MNVGQPKGCQGGLENFCLNPFNFGLAIMTSFFLLSTTNSYRDYCIKRIKIDTISCFEVL